MLIFIAITIVVIVFVFGAFYDRNVRRSGLQRLAEELDFRFEAEPDQITGLKLLRNSIILTERSNSSNFQDMMSGVRMGYRCYSVRFFFNHGRSGDIQTIICVDLNASKLPSFAIQKKSLLGMDKLLSGKEKEYVTQLGMMEILRNHVVIVDKGANITDIPDQFLRFFVNFPNYSCEYISGRLLIYQACVVVPPNKMRDYIDNAVHLGIILEKV